MKNLTLFQKNSSMFYHFVLINFFLFFFGQSSVNAFLSPTNTMIIKSTRNFFSTYQKSKFHTFFQRRPNRFHHLIHQSTNWDRPYSYLSCSSSNSNDYTKKNIATLSSDLESNEYLVQARIQARTEKRQTREKSIEEDRSRNLRIKRLIYNDANQSETNGKDDENENNVGFLIPKLYALRVSVDKELREELRMNGREKRGRVFIEEDSDGCTTLKGLKFELHAFFRCLKKSTYLLSAGMPQVLDDGSIYSPGCEDGEVNETDTDDDPYKDFIPIENDDDVHSIFQKAQEAFDSHNSNLAQDATNRLKRASVLLHVRKDPNAPKPPPPPPYLENMANPKDSETMTMLSFYSFPENGVEDPEEFSLFLRKIWKPFGALGRVYVAKEGVNAQMSIPTNV